LSPFFLPLPFALFFLRALLLSPFAVLALLRLAAFTGFGAFKFPLPFFAQLRSRFARFLFRLRIGVRPAADSSDQGKAEHRNNRKDPHHSLQQLLAFANASIWICDETRASRGRAEAPNLIR